MAAATDLFGDSLNTIGSTSRRRSGSGRGPGARRARGATSEENCVRPLRREPSEEAGPLFQPPREGCSQWPRWRRTARSRAGKDREGVEEDQARALEAPLARTSAAGLVGELGGAPSWWRIAAACTGGMGSEEKNAWCWRDPGLS